MFGLTESRKRPQFYIQLQLEHPFLQSLRLCDQQDILMLELTPQLHHPLLDKLFVDCSYYYCYLYYLKTATEIYLLSTRLLPADSTITSTVVPEDKYELTH